MDYSFLRQLSNPAEEKVFRQMLMLLTEKKIELYIEQAEEQFQLIGENGQDITGPVALYVAAADRKEAVRILEEAGFAGDISKEIQPVTASSELERATKLYYKRRKITMAAWGVVLLLAFCFYIVKAFVLH